MFENELTINALYGTYRKIALLEAHGDWLNDLYLQSDQGNAQSRRPAGSKADRRRKRKQERTNRKKGRR